MNEYTDWERTVQHPVNTKDACVQALSDAQFVAPLVQTGDLFTLRHTKKPNNPHIAPIPESEKEPLPKTYFYVFDYQMKDGDYPQVSHSFLLLWYPRIIKKKIIKKKKHSYIIERVIKRIVCDDKQRDTILLKLAICILLLAI